MGGRGSWLLVALVGAVAVVAAADALRGGGAPEASRPPETTASEPTTEETATEAAPPELAGADVAGVLYYTNARCELHAVRLPSLEQTEAPPWDECRFVLSPDAARASGAGSGWDPHSDPRIGRLFQSGGGTIEVASNRGPEGEPFPGEAPAWRPDGTLTYYADGAVLAWPDAETVLSQRDLVGAIRRHPDVPDAARFHRVGVREAAWLGDSRLAAILSASGRGGERADVFVVYEGTKLEQVLFAEPGELSELRAGPRGGVVALRAAGGLLLLGSGGRSLETPGLVGYRAVAFSPDESWAAVATQASVHVFRIDGADLDARELPIVASDLAWRGPEERDEVGVVGDVDEAREWLAGVRATGRLYLTEPGCRLRALRLPDLVWEEAVERPSPCRFVLGFDGAPLEEGVAVRPQGDRAARCTAEGVEVFGLQDGAVVERHPDACAPVWSTFGGLAFVRGGELVEAGSGGDERVLVSLRTVRSIFGPNARLEEAAWIDDERVWAAVRVSGGVELAALNATRIVSRPGFTARSIEDLRVSTTGMVTARTDRGVVVFDAGGRRAMTFPDGRAAAWMPGELILAIAAGGQILFVAPVSREVVSLAAAAEDIEWVVP